MKVHYIPIIDKDSTDNKKGTYGKQETLLAQSLEKPSPREERIHFSFRVIHVLKYRNLTT